MGFNVTLSQTVTESSTFTPTDGGYWRMEAQAIWLKHPFVVKEQGLIGDPRTVANGSAHQYDGVAFPVWRVSD